ncbi:class I fructose-bisphosphate aldolase [Blastococcus tunisiensis]|uniref:Probable fructose-bisphosphate aldolase class 1 n=1 Tax=Blastococcus tunisiensis TaxID=1798228 RepID=A0A1I2DZ17_9ACTN|nr:class I fructose-bisphosphate aldolase [Blastococcus sp. DSM 46838]SFE85647.1 fructose-bisphosphate aldolase [Blastococcus sp. DSM 46838]
MPLETMIATARELVEPGKGILAADESTPTMTKRLAAVGVESTEEHRRRYRQLLFGAPGIGEHISGVILFDETTRQRDDDGRPLPDLLRDRGVIPGIKVDLGTTPLAGFPHEVVTDGLDGLRGRLEEYAAMGLRFAKWRAVIRIGDGRPTPAAIEANAHALARYAALTQEAGLVPIVEPEVLMDGPHSLERCAEVTAETLRVVYDQLARHRVVLEASLLKPNMVVPGTEFAGRAAPQEVAGATIRILRETVPAAVPGIVFLSGGQSDEEATANLDALNRTGPQPWELSFSFGRALQAPVLRAWAGEDAHAEAAQAALLHRATMNGDARRGAYRRELETPVATGL